MNPNKHIVLYFLLSLFSIYLFLVFFTYQTFREENGALLPKSNYLLPHKQLALFKKTSTPINCNSNSDQLISPISYKDYQTKSNYPVIDCQSSCILKKSDHETTNLISYNDPKALITSIENIIIDEKSQIISYIVPLREPNIRVVSDWNGNLLQWIDEYPGQNHQLTLNHYNPDDETFVYQSTDGNTYHYLAKNIGLYINPCN